MNKSFIKVIQQKIKVTLFTEEDLKLLFHEKSLVQIHSSLSYHIKKNHILKFKRGVYSLVSSDEKIHFSKFSLGNILYSPSYISFESALSYHGLIPEAVYEITSACHLSKRKRFENSLGLFSYAHSPVKPFFLEVEKDEESGFLIASPIRALFDLIYRRKVIYSDLNGLELDLRIDLEDLKEHLQAYNASELLDLGEAYKKKSTRILANLLIRSFK
jgi:hypothetical protein